LELGQCFACECRELLDSRSYDIDGPFAQHHQKIINAHRGGVYFDARALKPRAEGSEAACIKSVDGVKTCRWTLKSVNAADETATALFVNEEGRTVLFSDLRAPKIINPNILKCLLLLIVQPSSHHAITHSALIVL
jgi:hypothetical protein